MSKGKWLRIEPDDRDRIVGIYLESRSTANAARRLGMSGRSVLKIVNAAGVHLPRGPRPHKD